MKRMAFTPFSLLIVVIFSACGTINDTPVPITPTLAIARPIPFAGNTITLATSTIIKPTSIPTIEASNTPQSVKTMIITTPPKKLLKAEDVILALKRSGLPITEVDIYDENTDPNGKLGRPHQYLYKANFHDSRLNLIKDPKSGFIDSESGGSIEIFPTVQDMQNRNNYIATAMAAFPQVTEYDYTNDTILLRISQKLKPSLAKTYEDALRDEVN